MTKYKVKYHYYRYNTGLDDNGWFNKEIICKDLPEAEAIYQRINYAFDEYNKAKNDIEYQMPDDVDQIEDDYIGHPGHFTQRAVVIEVAGSEAIVLS